MNATASIVPPSKPEPAAKLADAAITSQPELAKHYSKRELAELLERFVYRLKLAAIICSRIG